MIKAFWHISDNFGDKITPYILSKLGIEYQYVDKGCSEEHYIMCGSILTACNENSIIWGAGMAQPYDLQKPKQILAVRGIKTREYLLSKGIECPEVYGDPALILPFIYRPKLSGKKRKVGTIPHVIDYNGLNGWDLNKSVEETIDYIVESESIITSSLHAYIAAYTYSIPAKMIPSENVIGQEFKFQDFIQTFQDKGSCPFNMIDFVKSCPFKNRLLEYSAANDANN